MRISIGQLATSEDKVANLEAMVSAAEDAARQGSSLIVFPEQAMFFGKVLDERYLTAAEFIPGDFTAAIDALARRLEIAIAVGMVESIPGEHRVYNTIYVTGSDGRQVAAYRKVHLYDAFGLRESEVIAPSDDLKPAVFALEGTTVGVMTCYDLRFPESARALVDAGADVLLLPSAWTPGVRKEDHWETLVRARAIENTTYLVAANQAAPASTGSSLVVDPMGIVVAQLIEAVETRTVEIDDDRVAEVRVANPCIANRRFRVERTNPHAV